MSDNDKPKCLNDKPGREASRSWRGCRHCRQEDLERLLDVIAGKDFAAALRARNAVEKGYGLLADITFGSRKADDDANPFLRELIIPFGGAGYVALFEIENEAIVAVPAMRHQREEDYR